MTREEIALNIACDLLTGSVLYGYDYDRIFKEIMERDGVVSMLDIKEFILEHLEELGKEYFVEGVEPETKKRMYDKFAETFIDEKERDPIAPPERYVELGESDYHLKDVIVFKGDQFVGHGLLDENRRLLFSGYVTCEMSEKLGFVWKDGESNGEHQT